MLEGWPILAVTVVLLVFAGLIASIEAALLVVLETQVRGSVERREFGARRLMRWLDAPGDTVSTLALLRYLGLLGAGVSGWRFAMLWLATSQGVLVVAFVAVAALYISNLLPRSIARRYALTWARRTVGFSQLFTTLLLPVVKPLVFSAQWIAKHTGGDDAATLWPMETSERIRADARGVGLGKPDEDLMVSLLEFANTISREIMVPRTDMVALAVESAGDEIHRTVRSSGHARVPVYEDTVDNIIGVLHVKDLLYLVENGAQGDGGVTLKEFIRPTFYVPEVMKISELLREFQRRKTHMAIVVDEYGGTSGLVTLEDVIEEIVGEIQDEYDVEEKQLRRLGDNRFIADARVNLRDLEDALAVDFPDDGDYETLAGFLVSQAGYLPGSGEHFEWKGLKLVVKDADDRRIATVEIERHGDGA